MNNNIKTLFLISTLVFLLVSISAISATDIENTTIKDTSSTHVITSTSCTTEKVEVSDNNKEVKDTVTKTQEKPITKTSTTTLKKDNNITKTTKDVTTRKTLKKDSQIDYYVSGDKGLDTNDGTIDKPYKTINQALKQTTKDNIYNIHISSGKYTGIGNTNLTVNGDYKINFIGQNTIIDGEARYDMKKSLNPDEYYWESSPEWYPYENGTGNWAINITKGSGLITLINITIQNCWSAGGNNISSYKTATIDNYGNLTVNNVKFINNCAGVGAGIRNNHEATLYVNNSLFEGNRKSSSTGNEGVGIYNNGTATIINSTFQNNYARWGTILSDYKLTIINSTIKNNIAYDGTSTYKFGAGIAINTGKADYFNPYRNDGIDTKILNCNFTNNGQTDIYAGEGDLLVSECKFNNSTGIYIDSVNNNTMKAIIENSTIKDSQPSQLFKSLSVDDGTSFGIYALGNGNLTIRNNIIDFENNGYGLYVTGNTTITNNSIRNIIQVNGNNNNITNNNIKTIEDYAIYVKSTTKNNIITLNTLESNILYGDKAVENITGNVIENNTPTLGKTITITDETYENYFYKNGSVIPGAIESGSTINLVGDFYNRQFVIDSIHIVLKKNDRKYLYNTTITVKDDGRIHAEKLLINNEDYNPNGYVIYIGTLKNSLTKLKISSTSTKALTGVIINNKYNTLKSNTITIEGPSNNMKNNIPDTMGIFINSYGNKLDSNRINVYNTTNGQQKGVVAGIVLLNADNNVLNFNQASISGDEYAIGIYMINSSNNHYTSNFNGLRPTATNAIGTYLTGNVNNNQFIASSSYNYIKATNKGYLFIINATNGNNNTISGQSMNKLGTFTQGEDILLINTNNTFINKTTLSSNGIKIVNANNTIIFSSTLKNNNNTIVFINSTNNTINNTAISANYGIIFENSSNNTVINSNINTTETNTVTIINSNNTNVTKNYLNYNNTYGGDSSVRLIDSSNNIIKDNTPLIILLTNDNYNQYFKNSVLTSNETTIINLASNLYNKDLVFNIPVQFVNPNKYTIYNGTITIGENSTQTVIDGIILNSTDERETLVNIKGNKTTLQNGIIYHENHEKEAHSIVINNTGRVSQTLSKNNITTLGPEIKTKDNSPSTTSIKVISSNGLNYDFNTNNITTITTKYDNNGKISGMYNKLTINSFDIKIGSNNVVVKGYNDVTGLEGMYKSSYNNNIEVYANKTAYGIKMENSDRLSMDRDTFNVISNNTSKIFYINNITSYVQFSSIDLTVKAPTVIIVDINNANNPDAFMKGLGNLKWNKLNLDSKNTTIIKSNNSEISFSHKTGNITGENIILLDAENTVGEFSRLSYNITTNTTTPLIQLKNSQMNLKNNNIVVNTRNIPIISVQNSDVNITGNYLESFNLSGNEAILAINITGLIENNTPTTDNYKSYVNLDKDSVNANKTDNITINVVDSFNNIITSGIITVTIDNNITQYNLTKNPVVITINPTVEKFKISITYSGNEKYMESSTTKNINIVKNSVNITVDPVNGVYNDSINLTAHVKDVNGNNINTGKVIFNINGMTICDTDGNPIEVPVVNGTAILDTVAPRSWMKNNSTINALYLENDVYASGESSNETVTITQRTPTVTIMTDKTTVKSKDVVRFIVQVRDGNKLVTDGHVILKLNGKTLKDTNGNILLLDITNGIAYLDYEIPQGFSAKNYTATTLFVGRDYVKTYANTSLEVLKTNTHIDAKITDVIGNIANVKLNIYDETNNLVNRNTKVTVKINGKTVINQLNITGTGNINLTLPQTKDETYSIEIIAGENNGYESSTQTITYTIPKASKITTHIQSTATQITNKTATVAVQIYDDKNQLVTGNTKVVVKLNGKTLNNTVAKDGQVNMNITIPTKKATYTLTVIAGENNKYKESTIQVPLKVESIPKTKI